MHTQVPTLNFLTFHSIDQECIQALDLNSEGDNGEPGSSAPLRSDSNEPPESPGQSSPTLPPPIPIGGDPVILAALGMSPRGARSPRGGDFLSDIGGALVGRQPSDIGDDLVGVTRDLSGIGGGLVGVDSTNSDGHITQSY